MNKNWTEEAAAAVDKQDFLLLEEYPVALLVEISQKLDKLNDLLEKRTRLF